MSEELVNLTRRAFEQFTLDETLLCVNRACRAWRERELRLSLPLLETVGPGHSKFYWVAAETSRHAILWCLRRSSASQISLRCPKPSDSDLERLLGLATDVQLRVPYKGIEERLEEKGKEGIVDIGSWLFLPQYIVEKSSPWRIGQALLMYDEIPARLKKEDTKFPLEAYQDALRVVLGCNIDTFLVAIIHLKGISSSDNPRVSMNRAVEYTNTDLDRFLLHKDSGGLLQPAIASCIRALSAAPDEAMDHALFRANNESEYPYICCSNPLLRYPLIFPFRDNREFCVAPVPHLIMEWLYEPLMDLLYCECNEQLKVRHLSRIFEEYVGILAKECTPGDSGWIGEAELMVGYEGKVIDWAMEFRDTTILMDAKRCFISNECRYMSTSESWNQTRTTLMKGIRQCADCWANVKLERVPSLSRSKDNKAIGVIVTHSDSDYQASHWQTRKEIDDSLRELDVDSDFSWIVLSLDRYETLMTHWHSSNDILWLPRTLDAAIMSDRPKDAISKLELLPEGPLWDLLEEMVNRLMDRQDE